MEENNWKNTIKKFIGKYRYFIVAIIILSAIAFDVHGYIVAHREYVDLNNILEQKQKNIENTEINTAQRSDIEKNFEKKIIGSYIFYTGNIYTIDTWDDDYYVIKMDMAPKEWRRLNCVIDSTYKDTVYSLRPNQTITIKGYVDRTFLGYSVIDCEIITSHKKDDVSE